jgi:hypothetical protein
MAHAGETWCTNKLLHTRLRLSKWTSQGIIPSRRVVHSCRARLCQSRITEGKTMHMNQSYRMLKGFLRSRASGSRLPVTPGLFGCLLCGRACRAGTLSNCIAIVVVFAAIASDSYGQIVYQQNYDSLTAGQITRPPGAPGQDGYFDNSADYPQTYSTIENSIANPGQALLQVSPSSEGNAVQTVGA